MSKTRFYIFHGEDDIAIEVAVKKLRDGMGENGDLNTSEFEGESASVPEILNAVTSFPFLSDKRLVVVKGLIAWISRKGAGETGKKAVQQLLDDLPTLPDYARLVLVERGALSDKNKIVKLAESDPGGYVKNYTVPKDTTQWIIKRAKSEYDVEIEPRAAVAIASVTGDDLRRADNELIKLVNFVEPGRPINEADVAELTPYVAEANIFKMVDALADGHGELALRLLHRLLQDKDNNIFGIYAMIVRQFRMLLLAKDFYANGGRGNLGDAIGVRSSFVVQNVSRQSRSFSLEQLETIYRRLQQYDVDMKTGRIKPELALDLLVASVTD